MKSYFVDKRNEEVHISTTTFSKIYNILPLFHDYLDYGLGFHKK